MHGSTAIALFTGVAVALLGVTPAALAQTTATDSAHTLVTPHAPDPGRAGQLQQLPQGGYGVTTGGTSRYQTLTTPGGGTALAVPNGTSQSTVVQPGRHVTP